MVLGWVAPWEQNWTFDASVWPVVQSPNQSHSGPSGWKLRHLQVLSVSERLWQVCREQQQKQQHEQARPMEATKKKVDEERTDDGFLVGCGPSSPSDTCIAAESEVAISTAESLGWDTAWLLGWIGSRSSSSSLSEASTGASSFSADPDAAGEVSL